MTTEYPVLQVYLAQDLRPLFNIFYLQGQCHENFDFRFSTWISFPRAPDYTNRAVSNFYKNSRRYLQLKAQHWCRWHRWQMKKIFNQKIFHYFFWTPLSSRVSIQIHFFLQVHFKLLAVWSLLPLFATGVIYIGGKFAAGFVDTDGNLPPVLLTPVANLPPVSTTLAKLIEKFGADVIDTGGAPWLENISAKFLLIHEKN